MEVVSLSFRNDVP